MYFCPADKMWDRVESARDDSDTTLFFALLNLGELVVKSVVAGLVAAVEDIDRNQYRQLYRLVRADGLGEWAQSLDDVLSGPAAQHLLLDARVEQRELTQRCGTGTWQYAAVESLYECLREIDPTCDSLPVKVDARRWVALFAQLRNKTRGHGAPRSDTISRACIPLEHSMRLFVDNFHLFRRSWVYLHRSLSGKYRVTKISADTTPFDKFKTTYAITTKATLSDGVYVDFGQPAKVDLIRSDVDGLDFYYANGGATTKRFQMLSYITGAIFEADLTPFLGPPTELPPSETQGVGVLEAQGECFGNLPPEPQGYIKRERLEQELYTILSDDRHPVVTLVGRGGIGKTSLALKVLHKVAQSDRFGIILWFSARDIDLSLQGPKQVKAHVLSEKDVAKELVQLLEPSNISADKPEATTFFASTLTKSPYDSMPILFVFDNFETVRAPQDLYAWIDQHIRLPNKVLITTRSRDFKGDFPVEVTGMSEEECEQLIDSTVHLFSIQTPLTESYRHDLYRESDGHPYVIKVLLGEVKKTGRAEKVARIVASHDEILDALFERTYSHLSPVAQRVLLTLCNWRSVIPQLAVEAVLLRPQNERMDVERAVEELRQSSFIEETRSQEDQTPFLIVPLVAAIFGKRKLEVSPWRTAIEADTDLLRSLGVSQQSDIRQGIAPRIDRMFRELAKNATQSERALDQYRPVLEFIARKYPPAWLLLATLYEEEGATQSLKAAKEAVMRFLEMSTSDIESRRAWERLATLCRRTDDLSGEVHALAGLCQVPAVPFPMISNAVNRLNGLIHDGYRLDSDDKRIVAQRVAEVMIEQISDKGNATDCSRIAWLYLHLNDETRARDLTELGLTRDSENEYCFRLARRFGIL